jgi:hypothetical protein
MLHVTENNDRDRFLFWLGLPFVAVPCVLQVQPLTLGQLWYVLVQDRTFSSPSRLVLESCISENKDLIDS